MRPALGTFVEIVINDHDADTSFADKAFDQIQYIHHGLSFHQKDSYLNQLNLNPHQWIEMPLCIRRLLYVAQLLTFRTNQSFDCSIGRLLVHAGALPSPANNSMGQLRADGHFLAFSNKAVKLTQPVWLVMDGIAKGYAVDLAVKSLKTNGVKSAWVNAGGDLRIFGDISSIFHIRHQQKITASVQLSQTAMATSASENQPDFPALLIDEQNRPLTGCYAVAAPWAFLADALTKTIAACPADKVPALLALFRAQLVFQQK
ncbi:FAD:protein FMN transferase [Paraglaciecola sp.]|uniref:FAD:protein FMN transferase n=1 Tax=Paraglaciecola sp. TaxID=1920173 RepID=UPI0030F3AE8A